MNITTEGVVLKAGRLNGTDRICTIMTEKLGVIRAFAKGAQNPKNKNSSSTAQFSSGQFTLFSGRDRFLIDEAACGQPFFALRDNISSLALAQYLCELFSEIARTEENAREELRLLRGALHYLSTGTRPALLVKAAAEMRLLAWEGYAPDLTMCRECGTFESDTMFFLTKSGQLVCSDCARSFSEAAFPLGKGAAMALRHTVYAQLDKLFSFSLPDSTLAVLAKACEQYTITQLDREFSTLSFFHTVSDDTPSALPTDK